MPAFGCIHSSWSPTLNTSLVIFGVLILWPLIGPGGLPALQAETSATSTLAARGVTLKNPPTNNTRPYFILFICGHRYSLLLYFQIVVPFMGKQCNPVINGLLMPCGACA